MSDVVYDNRHTMALGIFSKSCKDRYKPQSKSQSEHWYRKKYRTICSDIVIYDQLVIPHIYSAPLLESFPDLSAFIDTYDYPDDPIDSLSPESSHRDNFLKYAIQLKPFFLGHLIRNASSPKEESSIWHIISYSSSGNDLVKNLSDLYDFFFISRVYDANSALECIRDNDLRVHMLNSYVAPLYYGDGHSRTNDGFIVSSYSDVHSSIYGGFADLIDKVWPSCVTTDFSSRFSHPMRLDIIDDITRNEDWRNLYIDEISPSTLLTTKNREDAFYIMESELREHINIIPTPSSISQALSMREKREWVRFREKLTKYQELLDGGISKESVAKEVINDILLAQKDIKKSEKIKRNSSILAYLSFPISTLELFLSMPSILSLGIGAISITLSFKAERMFNVNNWIALGDLRS